MGRGFRVGLAIAVLLVVLPAWVVFSVTLMEWLDTRFGPINFWLTTLAWVVLGIVWILPLKRVFLGVSAKGSAPGRFEDDPQ